jgi:hypothetical protein
MPEKLLDRPLPIASRGDETPSQRVIVKASLKSNFPWRVDLCTCRPAPGDKDLATEEQCRRMFYDWSQHVRILEEAASFKVIKFRHHIPDSARNQDAAV